MTSHELSIRRTSRFARSPRLIGALPAEFLIRMSRLNRLAREGARQERAAESGFTLLELMVVLAMILIVASIAIPSYRVIIIRSHEAVLKDDLFTLRKMIDQYTQDNHKPPESLDDLVTTGYLEGGLPNDPFTGSNQTWQPDIETVSPSPEESVAGVVDVHSGSNARSLTAAAILCRGPWISHGTTNP